MRKLFTNSWTKLAATVATMFFVVSTDAQVATNYTFSQTAGTYTPITGGTVVATATVGGTGAASLDDVIYPANPIPFTFEYNSVPYTSFNISTNGFITFGATAPANTLYTPISGATAYSGAIAGFGRDCQGNVTAGNLGEIRYEAVGIAPNRAFVIQYSNFRRFNQTEDWNMQIILSESTNIIAVVYDTPTVGTSTVYPQVGLRGANNTDYNNRTSTTNWSATTPGVANTSTITFTPAVSFTSGLTFIWTPLPACAGTPTPGSISGLSAVCPNTGTTLSLTGQTTGPGITYQWQSSTVPGGPYTNMGTATTQATGLLSVPMYYICVVTCTNGALSDTTAEHAITINTPPTIAVTPTTSSLCQPGATAVALTASGTSVTYAWGPAAGLSATTGSSVNALPGATTTYTVTGTGSNGCTATATSTISVFMTPGMGSVTATPPAVCSGGNSQLQANAYDNGALLNTYSFSTSTGATLDPMSGSTQVLNANNDDTPTATPAAIGFSFPFNGQSYSQYSVSPDGWLLLGGGTAAAQFTNAVASTTNIPKIYPYWDDCATGTDGNVKVLVTGTAPYRIFIVQWFVTIPRNVAGPANSTFQAWLYETTGIIEYRYGAMGAQTTNSISAGATAGATNFQSFTFSSNTSSTVTANNTNNSVPAVGRMYTLTPPSATNYTWSPATFLSSTTIANPMANGVTATTSYTVTSTSNGCTSLPGTVTITSGAPLMSSGSITPSNIVCENSNITLNVTPVGGGAPYTYAWSGPNSFNSVLQNPTITGVTLAAAGSYTVVISDGCAASNTVILTLTVNANPAVVVTPTSGLFCSGGPGVALGASGTATTYAWGPAAGLSATTGANVTASPTVNTTYTVTGTDGNGCSSAATTTVDYGVSPVVTASASPDSVCINGSTTLTAMASTPAAAYCQPVTSCTFPDIITNVTFGTINRTSTCDGAATQGYSFYPAINPTITAGLPTPLSVSTGGDVEGAAVWIDYNQNGVFEHPAEMVLNGFLNTNPATYNTSVTVPITAINGPTRMRVRCTYNTNPTTLLSPPCSNVTFGETEDYTITITGGVDPNTYAWTPATFLSSTTIANPVASAMTATTSYSVVATNTAGCTAAANVNVVVNPLPTVTASVSADPSCVNDQITFNGGGAASYTWTGGVVDNTPYTNTAAGSFSYTVTGTDANGCTNTASVSITVNSLPVVTLSGNSAICAGDTSFLTGTSGGTSQWYLNGSPIVGATSNTYAATAPGVYNMTKTNLNGCGDSAAVGITLVVNAAPTVTASATPSTVCAGDMVTATGSGAASYVWSGGISDNVPFAAMATMTYTVTGTDVNGCENIDSVTVTVNPLPMVAAMSSDTNTCMNDMVTFMGMGASSYTWNNGVTDMVPYMVTMTDTFIVTGTDANGCMAVDSLVITVNALPVVSASASDSLVCAGDSVTFMGSGALTYAWDNGVVDMMPYAVMASDTFIVIGTDANGCTGTDSVAVVANTNPAVTLSLPLDTACLLLGPVTLGGETPAGGTWSGTGVTGNSFDPGIAGNGMHAIMYTYMDSLTGCSSTAIDSILVDICNSIDNNNVGAAVVYPNPNNGDFTLIPAGSGLVDVMIYNATGQLVVAEKATAGQPNQIKLEASGMYSVVIVTVDGTRTTQRVVVNR